MKTLIRSMVELMGDHHDDRRHQLLSEVEVAERLGASVDDVRIAIGMMQTQGLLEPQAAGGEPALALSARGLEAYRHYREDG